MTAAPQEAPRLCGDWIAFDWISIVDGFCVSSSSCESHPRERRRSRDRGRREGGREGGREEEEREAGRDGERETCRESKDEQGEERERRVEVGHV